MNSQLEKERAFIGEYDSENKPLHEGDLVKIWFASWTIDDKITPVYKIYRITPWTNRRVPGVLYRLGTTGREWSGNGAVKYDKLPPGVNMEQTITHDDKPIEKPSFMTRDALECLNLLAS